MKTVLPARDNPVTPSLTVGWKKWSPYSNRARADRRASSTISEKRGAIRAWRTRFDGGNWRERYLESGDWPALTQPPSFGPGFCGGVYVSVDLAPRCIF